MTVTEPNAPISGQEVIADVDAGNGGLRETAGRAPVVAPNDSPSRTGMDDVSAQAQFTAEDLLLAVDRESLGLAEPPAAMVAPERRLDFRVASGRYRSAPAFYTLEMRVDVDGRRPLRKISGDYYQTSGATTSYYGSRAARAGAPAH